MSMPIWNKVIRTAYTRATKYPKRFFKEVRVVHASRDAFEINLDHRKLKTPGGNLFVLPNESLAQAVAHEWRIQVDTVDRQSMHLTTLCNTVIDNPTQRTEATIVEALLDYVDSDTVCCRTTEPEELHALQVEKWDPVLEMVQQTYTGVRPRTSTGISLPEPLPSEEVQIFRSHLLSFNRWSLTGLQYTIETLKSFYLGLLLKDANISVEDAVYLSRLETEFQVQRWGSVPWYHDLEIYEMQARVAAATLLMHFGDERRHITLLKSQSAH